MLRNVGGFSSRRHYASIAKSRACLGIRRETVNVWERRAPFSPGHVKKLTKMGIRVLIQPSNRRAFSIQDYMAADAVVQEDLSEAQLIISVKQTPIEQLIPNKTYAFFSHTIKAQKENMTLLDTILQRKIRLIDYEKMVDERGKRLVMFGKWAGFAGFTDLLHGLGLRLLALGHHTPFLHIGLAHNYNDSHMAINAFRDVGYEIALGKMPRSLGPLVFVFTGTGNVSKGVQELFEHLPHEYVDVATLPKVTQRGQLNKVYGCVVGRPDHMVRKAGGAFDLDEYELHPDRYESKFATEIAPYASVIFNCIYWNPDNPRLLTIPDAKYLLIPSAKQSLDVPGCPTLPHSFNLPTGCLVCSIDNMPAQMPIEASEHFGSLLLPYITDMLNCSTDQYFDRLNCRQEVKNAIITDSGNLTPKYQYIAELRNQKRSTLIDVHKDVQHLEKLISEHDICISLLPYSLHPLVARMCIKNQTNMVTSSYISLEMESLDQDAKNAEITVLNEVGLDPGIDHMLAMQCIDRVSEHGGNVTSFVSFCGGLPAPEFSDNPLRYKFSWSPKGVLQASINPARYLKDGSVVELAAGGAILDHPFPVDFMPGFNLVGFANRDSTLYARLYKIDTNCRTLLRGTLRYKGFADALKALNKVGLLSVEKNQMYNSAHGPDLTWKQLMALQLNQKMDIFPDSLRRVAAEMIGNDKLGFQALNSLELFSDTPAERLGTSLDTLASHLNKLLAFDKNERDLVILNHDVKVHLQGGTDELYRISLVAYGDPDGYSAMARTVGYTVGISAKMILDGEIQKRGMQRPLSKEIYRPVLARLEDLGIKAKTTVTLL